MGSVDSVTLLALAAVLSLLGLAVSVLLWRRRGAGPGLRGLAWSLLPVAAYLTGTLRLLLEVLDSVGRWAARLVFSPLVWSGVAVLAVAVVLFAVAGVVTNRADTGGRSGGRSGDRSGDHPRDDRGGRAGEPDEIEAILRKHGIS